MPSCEMKRKATLRRAGVASARGATAGTSLLRSQMTIGLDDAASEKSRSVNCNRRRPTGRRSSS
jgi:hypothetical protein